MVDNMSENIKNAFRKNTCGRCKQSHAKCWANMAYTFEGKDYEQCHFISFHLETAQDFDNFYALICAQDEAEGYTLSAKNIEVFKKPTSQEYINHLKGLIIPQTPKGFCKTIAAPFRLGLTDIELESGITAFRMFLNNFFDTIIGIEDNKNHGTFRDAVANVLYKLGKMGKFETKPSKQLIINGDFWVAQYKKPEIKKNVRELYQSLMGLGFRFTGVNFAKDAEFPKTPVIVEHEDDAVIVGLKLIAAAQDNTKDKFAKVHNIIMRGDFNPLVNDAPSPHVLYLHDFLYSQPPSVKEWLLDINKWLADSGCEVVKEKSNYFPKVDFVYTLKKGKKKTQICSIHVDVNKCYIILYGNHFTGGSNILSEFPTNQKYNKSGENGYVFTLHETAEFHLLKRWIELECSH